MLPTSHIHHAGYGSPSTLHEQPSAPSYSPMQTPLVFERLAPPKWEYRVLTVHNRRDEPLSEAQLAELGAEGWLLAGTAQLPAGDTTYTAYYFVRAL